MRIVCHRYRLMDPLDWHAECDAELDGMTRLWNVLVDIEAEHREEYRRIVSSSEAVASLQESLEAVQRQIDEIIRERKELNKSRRSKRGSENDTDKDRLAALRAERKALTEQLVEKKRAARNEMREEIARINQIRVDKVKQARQQSGLYWCNYNAVIESYETARSRAIKDGTMLRKQNAPSDRLVNQIINGASVDDIMTGDKQVGILPATDIGRGKIRPEHRTLSFTVYSRDRVRRTVRWPMIMSRPLPDGARVQSVIVTREAHPFDRRRGRWKWYVNFVCRVDGIEEVNARINACGIDVGWRVEGDELRVATLVDSRDAHEFILMPAHIMRRNDLINEMKSVARSALNEIIEHVGARIALLPDDVASEWRAAIEEKRIRNGLVQRAIDALVTALGDSDPIVQRMLEWRSEDRRAWRLISDMTHRIMRQRKDFYQQVVNRITDTYRVIGIENIDWKRIGEHRYGNTPVSGGMRKLASPGVFTTMLINAARKKGRIVYRHDGPSSFVCGDCGTHTYVSDRKELYFTCAGCDSVHDQDVNAARTICAAAVASADVVAADGAALAHVLPTTYIGRWERSKAAKAAKAGGLASDEKPS
jgi:hypothetical protein